MRDLANLLRSRYGHDDVVGLTDNEVSEVQEDQELSGLPGAYVEFLTLMGRRAGKLLVGTDIFYPSIVGIKRDASELLEECGVRDLVPNDALVFAMHQGYQVYWMADVSTGDPAVSMYQEGEDGITREWSSFSSFLWDEYSAM
ncbi:SMI1/KNR4 family protein [Kibdelosporangium persicum]|uniref:SMI1/KNR4 family protein n=1 Tax=Kibdelosporangium persicum TaxID=2698649 RepID=UPI0015664418|nr:SMI1/KNR4 family protein [Kibdelosporangium persicum]